MDLESWTLESGIQPNKSTSRQWLNLWIQVPLTKNPESSTLPRLGVHAPFFSYPLFTICSFALSFYFFFSLFIFQKFNLDSRALLHCAWQRTKRAESKHELWGRDCRQLSRYAHAHWCTGNYPLLFVLGRVRHGSLQAVSEKTVRKTRKPLLNWNERNALMTKYKTISFWFLTKNDTVKLC